MVPAVKLRTGRENGRTIYIQMGDEPSKDDPMVGTMDTASLSARMVYCFNRTMPALGPWLRDEIAMYNLDLVRQLPE